MTTSTMLVLLVSLDNLASVCTALRLTRHAATATATATSNNAATPPDRMRATPCVAYLEPVDDHDSTTRDQRQRRLDKAEPTAASSSSKPLAYYEGMLTSTLDFREDEKLDNLTPNVKFVASSLAVVALLLLGFLGSNGLL